MSGGWVGFSGWGLVYSLACLFGVLICCLFCLVCLLVVLIVLICLSGRPAGRPWLPLSLCLFIYLCVYPVIIMRNAMYARLSFGKIGKKNVLEYVYAFYQMILVKKITMMILINVTVSNDGDSDDDGYDINTNNLHCNLYILNRQSISDQTTALSFSSIHTFQNTNSSQSSSSCHTKHLICHLPSIRLPRTTLTSPPNLYPQVVPRQSYSGWSMTK